MKFIYLTIFVILFLYVNFKRMSSIQQLHDTYKFQKYISTNDLQMLYFVYYNNKQLINLTLIIEGKYTESFNIFRGKMNYQGKQIDLETTITVGYGIFEIKIPKLNVSILFKLNSIVKYTIGENHYDVNHGTCRFYN